MLSYQNEGKNPNSLHDYLLQNGCIVKQLAHNRLYDEEFNMLEEATVINVLVDDEQEELCNQLVIDFMSRF